MQLSLFKSYEIFYTIHEVLSEKQANVVSNRERNHLSSILLQRQPYILASAKSNVSSLFSRQNQANNVNHIVTKQKNTFT